MTNQTQPIKQYRVTRESCRLAGACYAEDRLAKLIPPDGLTPEEVAAAEVPVADRVWALCYAAGLDSKSLRLFAGRTARRALDRVANPDPLSVAAIETAERFANGAATEEELEVARKQAYSTYSTYFAAAASAAASAASAAAHRAVCSDVFDAAYYTAHYAVRSVAYYADADRQAERELQLQDLLTCFRGTNNT